MVAFRDPEFDVSIWTREQLLEIGAAALVRRLLGLPHLPDRIEISPLQADLAAPVTACYQAWEARQPNKTEAVRRLRALAHRSN